MSAAVNNKVRTTTLVLAILATLHIFMAYGLPEGLTLTVTALLGVLYFRSGTAGAVMITASLLIVTLLYAGFLAVSGLGKNVYYRPDEQLWAYDKVHQHHIYKKNTVLEMDVPHGDLQSMTTENISRPHHVRYQIDSRGFRNSADYRGQKLLLVGDSFVVGSDNSQEDILSEQLSRHHGIEAYSLAYPGDSSDYAAYARGFLPGAVPEAKVALFLFEGNDFINYQERKKSAFKQFTKDYYRLFSNTNIYRFTQSIYKRARNYFMLGDGYNLEISEIAGKKMAFFKSYVEESQRTQTPPLPAMEEAFTEHKDRIAHVYFIPTKYRVYYEWTGHNTPLPNAHWEYTQTLCKRYGVPCTNLTAPLTEASRQLLKERSFTWWEDDTHWNRNGIAVAARVVAEDLRHTAHSRH